MVFEAPEEIWEAFTDYVAEVKSNPRYKTVFVGKDGTKEQEELQRPLTMEGFELYLWDKGIARGADQYFTNQEGRYEQFVEVCSRIKKPSAKTKSRGAWLGSTTPASRNGSTA